MDQIGIESTRNRGPPIQKAPEDLARFGSGGARRRTGEPVRDRRGPGRGADPRRGEDKPGWGAQLDGAEVSEVAPAAVKPEWFVMKEQKYLGRKLSYQALVCV